MKVTQEQLKMARLLLAQPEENGFETTEELLFEEAVVRARLEPDHLDKILGEMKLDPTAEQTWIDLERMTVWL